MSKNYADLHQPEVDSQARQKYVTALFDDLAPKYDRFNRFVSLSRDEAWRKTAIKLLGAQADGVILDLASGTGDLANSAKRHGARGVHAFDISHEMLKLAKDKLLPENGSAAYVGVTQGSAHLLPFKSASINGVVSGFAMRNVFHFLDDVLAEIYRVLTPGGRFAILEMSQPHNAVLRFGFRVHMQTVMPLIGRLTTGQHSPFQYLRQTTMTFLRPEAFQERLESAGFREVMWKPQLFGAIAIHSGVKPGR